MSPVQTHHDKKLRLVPRILDGSYTHEAMMYLINQDTTYSSQTDENSGLNLVGSWLGTHGEWWT